MGICAAEVKPPCGWKGVCEVMGTWEHAETWLRVGGLCGSGGAQAVDEGAGAGGDKADDGDGEAQTYYDAMKQEMAERTARTKAALAALPPAQRIALEGHRPGTYLRLLLSGDA